MKRVRVPLSYPASDDFDGVVQAVCQGGSFAVESVAAFAWNGWQASSGISGNLGLEYAKEQEPESITVYAPYAAGKDTVLYTDPDYKNASGYCAKALNT
ncbi:hypothetical protein [Marinobacter salicampi]|uniref:hypothetical protein n=1 Tax=Marinobacter salicampi TaxID=435907 RepID=UPI001407E4F8|nr:hypothetical protein [Marinobacter salicampi]